MKLHNTALGIANSLYRRKLIRIGLYSNIRLAARKTHAHPTKVGRGLHCNHTSCSMHLDVGEVRDEERPVLELSNVVHSLVNSISVID